MSQGFLPICKKDMEERGWEQLDFVYISGDAYVDHPSFGPAVITRLLEDYGYKVGIIAQPDWKDKNSITVLASQDLLFLYRQVYGFYGKSLLCIQEAEKNGCIYARWRGRSQTGLCGCSLRQSDPSDIQAYADHPGRNRSKSPENGTL